MSRFDDITAALEVLMKGITAAGGYRTDAGWNVWKNLEYQTQPPATPCVIIYPGDVSDTLDGEAPPSLGEENHYLPLKLEGVIDDTERGEQGEALRQDILQALKSDRTLGGLSEGFEGAITSSSKVEQAGEGGFISFVEVQITLFYVTLYGAS